METTENSRGLREKTQQKKNQETPSQEPKKENDNVVFIGSKHLMNYVNSINMQLKVNQNVVVKARGKFISKSVDIVEVAKRQSEDGNISIKDINIATEEYESEGKKVRVSTIDISLSR